jgi:hypothetical protein
LSQTLPRSNGQAPVRIAEVKIWETDTSTATYRS